MRKSLILSLAVLLMLSLSGLGYAFESVRFVDRDFSVARAPEHMILITDGVPSRESVRAELEAAGLWDRVETIEVAAHLNRALVTFKTSRSQPDITQLQALRGVRRSFPAPIIQQTRAPLFLSGQISLRVNEGVAYDDVEALLAGYPVRVIEAGEDDTYLLSITEESFDDLALVNALRQRTDMFTWVEPNLLHTLIPRSVPNDTYYGDQWHLNNSGSWLGYGGGTRGADINVQAAWDISTGSPAVTIAIVDDGIDINHEDFSGRLVDGYDFLDSDSNPSHPSGTSPDGSPWGHGTAVGGCAAAAGNNNKGVSGVCQNCMLMGLRLIGEAVSDWTVSNAFRWACQRGADVINNSWGYNRAISMTSTLKSAIDTCTNEGRNGLGTVFVWAAGNEGRQVYSYEMEGYSRVLCVGASTEDDTRSSYSNYGEPLDVVAPSSGGQWAIVTTDVSGYGGYNRSGTHIQGVTDLDRAGNYSAFFGGTSAASPIAAGLVGLIISVNPNLSYSQIIDILRDTADKVPYASSYDNSGHSDYYGYGRINARAALEAAGGEPGCGDINWRGRCNGNVAIWCDNDTLISENCTEAGTFCGLGRDGNYRCLDCVPSTSSCRDNKDNDCDDEVDEEDECSGGECWPASFQKRCENGAFVTCGADKQVKRETCQSQNSCATASCNVVMGCTTKPKDNCTRCDFTSIIDGWCVSGECTFPGEGSCGQNYSCRVGMPDKNNMCVYCNLPSNTPCGETSSGICLLGECKGEDVDDPPPPPKPDGDDEPADGDIQADGDGFVDGDIHVTDGDQTGSGATDGGCAQTGGATWLLALLMIAGVIRRRTAYND